MKAYLRRVFSSALIFSTFFLSSLSLEDSVVLNSSQLRMPFSCPAAMRFSLLVFTVVVAAASLQAWTRQVSVCYPLTTRTFERR
jgi:hypothetical protein